MKYIVFEIQEKAGGSVGTLTSAHDSFNEAEQKYHTVLAAAAVSTVECHSCVMLTSDGRFLKSEKYEHKAEAEEGESEA